MSESRTHQLLVSKLVEHIKQIVGESLDCFIQADNCEGYSISPILEDGFRPDIYYEYNNNLIIGEAKTSNDISREHSINQYRSYLKTCQHYHGKAKFIIAVPYLDYAEANNIVKKIKKSFPGNYKVEIIKEYI